MRGSYSLGLTLVALYFVAGTAGDLSALLGLGSTGTQAEIAWAGHLASFVLLAAALVAFAVGWHRETAETHAREGSDAR